MTNLTGPAFLAGSIPQIVPFSVRETPTILSNVEAMRVWIRDQLVPFVNGASTQLSDDWGTEKTELIEGWEALTTQLIERVDSAVEGVNESVTEAEAAKVAAESARDLAELFASQVEAFQDAAITSIFTNPETNFRIAFESSIDRVEEDENDPGTFVIVGSDTEPDPTPNAILPDPNDPGFFV